VVLVAEGDGLIAHHVDFGDVGRAIDAVPSKRYRGGDEQPAEDCHLRERIHAGMKDLCHRILLSSSWRSSYRNENLAVQEQTWLGAAASWPGCLGCRHNLQHSCFKAQSGPSQFGIACQLLSPSLVAHPSRLLPGYDNVEGCTELRIDVRQIVTPRFAKRNVGLEQLAINLPCRYPKPYGKADR